MFNWVFSLRFRLILGFSLILVLALGGVGFYVARAAEQQAERFDHRREQAQERRIARLVARGYDDDGEWRELQPILERTGPAFGRRIVVRDRDGNEEHNSDYVIQRGDLVGIFHGAEMMDFTQHNGFYGYVLRDGETELPPEILRLWDQAMELRDIFRRNIAAGLTGEENLDAVVARIEEAGYLHIQENSYDATADSDATQVHIDFHAQGRFVSEEHAPRISATGWGRGLTIPLYHTFALSYAIHMPVPAWGEGEHLYLAIHDGATVTERGVEFPAPLPQQIRAIR